MPSYVSVYIRGRGFVRVLVRVCVVCDKEFGPKVSGQKYCSLSCGKKACYAVQLIHARNLQTSTNRIKMARGCIDCGYRLHPSALQFDHIPLRGRKIKAVSKFCNARKMREEILKCEVRCANCHFIKTMERRALKRALTPAQERNIQSIVRRLVIAGTLNLV